MSIYNFTSYSRYLAAELDRRKEANGLYSLRSMAQALGVSATTLSDVIKGKKKLSERTAFEVGQKLNLNKRENQYFLTLLHYENTEDSNLRKILESQLRVLNPVLRQESEVDQNQFIALSEWHHIAILELTYIFPKKMNAVIVSEQLNITVSEATDALALLENLSLIEKQGEAYVKTRNQFTFNSELSNQALRHFHRTMLGKAQTAIVEQTNKEKFIGSETFPLAIEDLQEAKDIVENCFQQLLQLSKKSENRRHIFHAGIQIFQLNRSTKKESYHE